MQTSICVTVITAFLSGLVTFFISTYFYVRHESRKEELALLKENMDNRHGLTPGGNAEVKTRFFQALNAVFAPFHHSKQVIEALQDFKTHKNRASDNVTQFIRRMSQDLKIDTSYLEDGFLTSHLLRVRNHAENITSGLRLTLPHTTPALKNGTRI